MKRSFALIAAGGITTTLAVFVLIAVLSTMAVPTAADQSVAAPVSEPTQIVQPADFAPQENFNAEFEATVKEREQLLQGQIAQLQQALVEIDTTSQAQVAGLEQQIVGIQGQSEQVVSSIESLQGHAGSLQQAIQADGNTFQIEMDKMTNAEAQMRQQIDALNTQLTSAYNQITQQQALAAAAAQAAAIQNSGRGSGDDSHSSSGGGGGHDDDGGHDDHDDDHDDDHEDDD